MSTMRSYDEAEEARPTTPSMESEESYTEEHDTIWFLIRVVCTIIDPKDSLSGSGSCQGAARVVRFENVQDVGDMTPAMEDWRRLCDKSGIQPDAKANKSRQEKHFEKHWKFGSHKVLKKTFDVSDQARGYSTAGLRSSGLRTTVGNLRVKVSTWLEQELGEKVSLQDIEFYVRSDFGDMHTSLGDDYFPLRNVGNVQEQQGVPRSEIGLGKGPTLYVKYWKSMNFADDDDREEHRRCRSHSIATRVREAALTRWAEANRREAEPDPTGNQEFE